MKKPFYILSGLVMSLGLYGATYAQNHHPSPQQAYQEAMQTCTKLTGAAAQNCKRDAGAALQQAKRTPPPMHNEATLQKNRVARCHGIPNPVRQQECIAQMTGEIPATVFGSVEGGGVLRESVITIPDTPSKTQSPTHPTHTGIIR